MKEKDYILVKDLARLESAHVILTNIVPQISEIIDEHEHKAIIKKVRILIDKHYEELNECR